MDLQRLASDEDQDVPPIVKTVFVSDVIVLVIFPPQRH
jgi:hypothetical protein